jgi:arylsulfatase A-like enzyme
MAELSKRSALSLLMLTAGVAGSIGAALALFLAACHLVAEGYLGAGMWVNAAATLREQLVWPSLAGLGLGGLLGAWGALRPVLFGAPAVVPVGVSFGTHPAVAALAVLAIALTLQFAPNADLRRVREILVMGVIAASLLGLLIALGRRLSEEARPWLERCIVGLVVASLVTWQALLQLDGRAGHVGDLPRGLSLGGAAVLFTFVLAIGVWAQPRLAVSGRAALGVASVSIAFPLGVALVGFAAPRLVDPTLVAAKPRSVLLINIDTLRADHTDLHPNPRDTRSRTPEIAALATRGTVYERAYSQAPWTLPANASVFTGLYPNQHRAFSLQGWLPGRSTVLAELLREAGYQTGAVVSHYFLARGVGFAQGFDHFDDGLADTNTHLARTAEAVTDRAIAWLRGRDPTRPFLLMAHYFDPHNEYLDHPDFDFADAYTGWLTESRATLELLRLQDHHLDDADLGYLRDLYDEEVVATDRAIARLLAELEHQGLSQDVIIVVYSDHGEGFREHGWLGHATTVHEELVRVPLVVVDPSESAGRIDTVTETRALFWSLLDRLGLDFGVDHPDRRLLPERSGQSAQAYSMVWLPDAPPESGKIHMQTGVHTATESLLEDHLRGVVDWYDLVVDPAEQAPRNQPEAEGQRALQDALDAWLRAHPIEEAVARELSGEEVEMLKALGYL